MFTGKQIEDYNSDKIRNHQREYDFLTNQLSSRGIHVSEIIEKLGAFQIAIPSWALGTGGTRFGRFPQGGEPSNLEQKIEDVGILHQLTASCDAISLHIPWDIPKDAKKIKDLAVTKNIRFDAVNSNTFQDQTGSSVSYKFGSLSHIDNEVRDVAINHNKQVIDYGIQLGSKSITIWLADGSGFPGQHNFREALKRTKKSLKEIYEYLPEDWTMLIEYKPYEPNFYSMVIPDWGTSHLLASELGPKALSLVDLGHHLPNTNIEQVVAILMMQNKLGGFHFNDSKYGDDDATVGSVKPFQLFLIFNELVDGMKNTDNPQISWMIDASHNLKDPLEDLIQSVEAIRIAYTQALIIDRNRLENSQKKNDVALTQRLLQEAFRTDVRPILAAARIQSGGVIDPLNAYREFEIRKKLIDQRGKSSTATGL